jgi:hypothetical protein
VEAEHCDERFTANPSLLIAKAVTASKTHFCDRENDIDYFSLAFLQVPAPEFTFFST